MKQFCVEVVLINLPGSFNFHCGNLDIEIGEEFKSMEGQIKGAFHGHHFVISGQYYEQQD